MARLDPVSAKELSSWDIIVTQLAQPLVMLSPKDSNTIISPEAANRMAKEFQSRFEGPGKGGVLINTEAMDLSPISWPPKDQIGLVLQDNLKTAICNAYHVPRTLLDMQDSNFASAKTAERSFQLLCLTPRINYLLERVTHCLVRRFDPDGRAFLSADDFVEKDEQLELQRQQVAVTAYQAGAVTKNELRAVFDLAPLADGNGTYTPPAPAAPFQLAAGDVTTKALDPGQRYDRFPLKPVVQVLQKWFTKQAEDVLGKTKTADGLQTKAWVDLSSYTTAMAHDLMPAVQVYYEEAGREFVTRLGLTDDTWQLVQPRIREAVKSASFKFAQSTNRTTAMELEQAKAQLADQLAAGLERGEYVKQLRERVQEVFTRASDERAYLIADTERTRAITTAENTTAKAAGVKAKVWLPDAMACPVCKGLDGVRRAVDEPYFVDKSKGDYAVVQGPPAHPGCRCTQTFEVE